MSDENNKLFLGRQIAPEKKQVLMFRRIRIGESHKYKLIEKHQAA